MKDDKKSSILKDALCDYNAIKEAADANAKKKLAEEFPDKFNIFLKEELSKNKLIKESYKKLDENKESQKDEIISNNKESVMKKQIEETEMVEETTSERKSFTEKSKKDVKISDTVGKSDSFTQKTKKNDNIEENFSKNDAFTEKEKKSFQTEEFDITELDIQSVSNALEEAEEDDEVITMDEIEKEINSIEEAEKDDEVITMDEIEKEINSMEDLGEELKTNSPSCAKKKNKRVAFNQLVELNKQLDEILSKMGEINDADENEKLSSSNQVSQLHQNNSPIDDEEITDADIEAVLNTEIDDEPDEESVDETIAMPHPNKRATTGTLPGKQYQSQGNVNRMRFAIRESDKKITELINENKNLTKKLNEIKKYKQSVTTLIEQYKSALEKYRNQLKEMAIFNTNLAHVNNLLVNESLALTQKDKIRIINEFKKIDSIVESQNKYKAILSEMKDSHKTFTESIENRLSASIQPSSKQKLDEVIEKTAYENNEHINKMKRLIEYVEGNRGKK